jgi:hypothetical protein
LFYTYAAIAKLLELCLQSKHLPFGSLLMPNNMASISVSITHHHHHHHRSGCLGAAATEFQPDPFLASLTMLSAESDLVVGA